MSPAAKSSIRLMSKMYVSTAPLEVPGVTLATLRITPVGTIPIVHTNRTRQHHDAFWLPYRLPSGASSKSSAWLATLVASHL